MAVVLDAFVKIALANLSALLQEKACMVLEVGDDLKKLLRRLERLKIFLVDAESKSIQDLSIQSWLGELKDFMYDADDVIDLCRIEGAKLLEGHQPSTSTTPSVRSCFPLISCFSATKFRYQIAGQIKSLNDTLKEIEDNKPTRLEVITTKRSHSVNGCQTSPEMVESDYVGANIKEATHRLVSSLIEESEHRTKCCVWGIVGMGGIGKTTLASKVYNHPSIASHFAVRIWVCVSQTFLEMDVLKQIIRAAGGVYGEASSKAELHSLLISSLSSNFFIVLDDVWRIDVWEDSLRSPLEKCGAPSGRVVVTTRDVAIAKNMRASIHYVEKMDTSDGWTLLCKKVFGDNGKEEEMLSLKDVGVQIVDKCDGLPLAIKAIAGVLTSNDISRKEWVKLLRSHAWSMDQLPRELRGALYLSYDDLPSHLRQCFLYCSLYPEDALIYKVDLIRYWVAEGFIREDEGDTLMEDIAEDHYNELCRRSLLQPEPSSDGSSKCRMHDLVRSLAQFLIGEENFSFVGDELTKTSTKTNILRNVRRLSFANTRETTTLMSHAIKEKAQGLRTLICHGTLPSDVRTMLQSNDLVNFLGRLRVLDLSDSGIERLPDSVGKLVHLRYLDLNRTSIRKLPDSIKDLVSLESLCLSGCENLHNLPKGITQLCNLRCLTADDTPLAYLPKGFNQMKQLNCLHGFFVADVDSLSEACKMEELQPLSQLRELSIFNVKRVTTGASVLTNKPFLRDLSLYFGSVNENCFQYGATEIERLEKVMEELCPPSCLQVLLIKGYPGYRYPCWMSLYICFSSLETVYLYDCVSCTQLPPLGQLPQLIRLDITGANSVVTVGPELLFSSHTSMGREHFQNWNTLSFGRCPIGKNGCWAMPMMRGSSRES